MDVDQMRRLRRLLEIADDDEDDEPDISAGIGKKRLHDMNSRLTQLIRAIGPVRTITMKRRVKEYFVSFIYDSPGPCGDQPMMDEFSIEFNSHFNSYDDGRIYVVPRFQRGRHHHHDRPSNEALVQWLELATGMTWDGAGLELKGWDRAGDGNFWYTYDGSQPGGRYMEIVDLLTQPEAQQLFAWSNDRAVVFNR